MRVLEICTALDGGGVDRYLLNYCSRIQDVDFDFVVIDGKEGILEAPLKACGFSIFKVPRITAGIRKNYQALKKIMLSGEYDIVHSHLGHKSIVALWCAKRCGISVRITHAHIAFVPETFLSKQVRKVCTWIAKRLSTHLVGCGVDAAKWLWGEKVYAAGKVTVFNNAIETDTYAYSESVRQTKRDELGLGNAPVFASIGRISAQKNQRFALEIFCEIAKQKKDAVMLFIGRGEAEDELQKRAEAMGIADKVHFLGIRDDVPRLLSAIDVLLFPSLYEGLPFTLIEAQCNGVPTICSDTVTSLVKYSDTLRFASLKASARIWAQEAIAMEAYGHAVFGKKETQNAGYDIDIEAQKLAKYYWDKVN